MFNHTPFQPVTPTEKARKLANFLAEAQQIAISNPATLIELIRVLGKQVQWQLITDLFYWQTDRPIDLVELQTYLFFDPQAPLTPDGKSLYDLGQIKHTRQELSMGKDIILAQPWSVDKLYRAFRMIGNGKSSGRWQQDGNHRIELWEPLHIAWVNGGNHSISAGMLQGEGSIVPVDVYDISGVFPYVRCDGEFYFRTYDNLKIGRVESVEFAAIFEIGRILANKT
ncbi:MAG: hypothetical protein KF770_23670 [Anaerolineae bacterium]|nr:hypothetical protein [Anaerolineae bacterium]